MKYTEALYFTPFVLNLLRYLFIAGTAFLIFYVLFSRKFKTNKIQSKKAKRKDFLREISFSLQTIAIIASVIMLIVFTGLREHTQFYGDINQYPIWWVPISVVLALILHDTYFYWMHRSIHSKRLYRKVHYVHHRSINPSPWAAYSFGFLEGVLEALIAPIILFIIPIHPIGLIAFTMMSLFINVYGHLGFEITPKWFRKSFLFEILNTSVHHNLHHEKFNGNYGLYFRVWDRIMKTENPNYVKSFDAIQQKRFETKNKLI